LITVAQPPAHATPAETLPSFPWDTIAEYKDLAARHPDGLIDLSVGSPVDRVPVAVRTALADGSDSPGYPQVAGTRELRGAYAAWLARAHGVSVEPANVLPTIGSKELVASLPGQLGLGAGDTVVIPELAYPTYEVGVRMAGATLVRGDAADLVTANLGAGNLGAGNLGAGNLGAKKPVSMIWLNSPSNPTGAVLSSAEMARVVAWARARGVIVASDECYIDLGWDVTPQSILDAEVSGGDHTGLLAVHSLSKRSNLAGYRLGFVSGDPALVARLTALRRHLGLIVPGPVQAAGVAALTDDAPVMAQRSRYAARRDALTAALGRAGFTIEHSAAGLYLWCTRGEAALDSVAYLAARGILVAPGTFYGPAGARYVRVALTATDERVAAVAARLAH
jgi:succinyldiaminopimelate transaminase